MKYEPLGGAPFQFKEKEARAALKVLGWSTASVIVTFLITLIGAVDIAPQYAFLIPVVNTILYSVKEYIADNR